jgi:hypothetical protein
MGSALLPMGCGERLLLRCAQGPRRRPATQVRDVAARGFGVCVRRGGRTAAAGTKLLVLTVIRKLSRGPDSGVVAGGNA